MQKSYNTRFKYGTLNINKKKNSKKENERSQKTYDEIEKRPKELTLQAAYTCKKKKTKNR